MCYCPTPTLHLNLALTGDGAFLLSPQKTYSAWFISILNYGDTENVLINHLLLVIPMSYLCHYTNVCPHKPHKHAHTHTHTHTHTSLSILLKCRFIVFQKYQFTFTNIYFSINCNNPGRFLFAGVWQQPALHTEIWSDHHDTKKQNKLRRTKSRRTGATSQRYLPAKLQLY